MEMFALIKNENGTRIIRPALSASTRTMIAGMADIMGYAHQKKGAPMSVLTLRNEDDSIECGGRFKYIKPEILMSYENLVEAVREAIEKEAEEHDNKFITDEKQKATHREEYDFDVLMKEFKGLVQDLMTKDTNNGDKITSVIEHYLGKGKKASEITPYQAEFLYLIIEDLKNIKVEDAATG